MKRLSVVLFVLVIAATASWAQITFPSLDSLENNGSYNANVYSLERSVTGGLSLNEIDKSFTADNDFGSVGNPFLYMGVLGDPSQLTNTGSNSSLNLGYYQNGKIPFSAGGSFSATQRANAVPADKTVDSNDQTVTVLGAGTSTNYVWSTTSTATTYALPSALNGFTGSFQGLLNLGGITTGLFFQANPNWASTDFAAANNNYKTDTITHNYNTAAAGVAPVVATDYTVTNMYKNATGALGAGLSGTYTTSSVVNFLVPFDMKTGKLQHTAYVGIGLQGSDGSATYTSTTSAAANTVLGTITDSDMKIDSSNNQTTIMGGYTLTMPGFFGAANGNEFSAGLAVTDAITTSTYDYELKTSNFAAGAINTKNATAGSDAIATSSYDPANYIELDGMAQHSIYFQPVQGALIGIAPQVVFTYSNDGNQAVDNIANGAIRTSYVTYTTPLNAAGAYDGTTYFKDTFTMTGTPKSISAIGFGINLPTAFKLKPDGWFFGFYTGATPYMSFTWTTTTTAGITTVDKQETITNGVVTNTANGTPTISQASSTTVLAPSFGEKHSFGIFIPFQGNIRADISLNGDNLLLFENLTLQLYVPLK